MFKIVSTLLLSTTFVIHCHGMEREPNSPITPGGVHHPVIIPPTIDETTENLNQIDSALPSLSNANIV